MTLTDESGSMILDFPGFIAAKRYDTYENQCNGLKLVDYVTEDESNLYFIEVKNYINNSPSIKIQNAMNKRLNADYRMLTDPSAAFPLEVGMKFKDSMFHYLMSGNDFSKNISLLLIINPPPQLTARDRLRLKTNINNGYIPNNMHKNPDKYPRIQPIYFDMPTLTEAKELYGINVCMQT